MNKPVPPEAWSIVSNLGPFHVRLHEADLDEEDFRKLIKILKKARKIMKKNMKEHLEYGK